jgi:hypothetical protein
MPKCAQRSGGHLPDELVARREPAAPAHAAGVLLPATADDEAASGAEHQRRARRLPKLSSAYHRSQYSTPLAAIIGVLETTTFALPLSALPPAVQLRAPLLERLGFSGEDVARTRTPDRPPLPPALFLRPREGFGEAAL